jgi:hypothetical protein
VPIWVRADDADASVKTLLDRVLTPVGVGVMTSVDRQRRDGSPRPTYA